MNKIHFKSILYTTIILFIMGLSGCGMRQIEDISHTVDNNYTEDKGYTLLIYMCGNNLETKSGEATKNIAEMLSVELPENTNIIIQTGGTKTWRGYDIPNDKSCRYKIENNELVLLEKNNTVNMGQADSLTDFLVWGEKNYGAGQMSVILWDHGGGSLKGVCYDEQNNNDALTLEELGNSFKNARTTTNRNYDFIGFDACLMATYDVADLLSPYADNLIASEEVEPSGGWNYSAFISELGKDDYYSVILSSYADKCIASGKENYTLSKIDLTSFSEIRTAFNLFCENISEKDLTYLSKNAGSSICFGTNKYNLYTNLIDLSLFALSCDDKGIAEAIKKNVDSVSGKYEKGAAGISLYFPLNSTESVSDYISICNNEIYNSFLQKNFTDAQKDLIKFVNKGEDNNGKLKVTVSADSQPNVVKTTYRLYRFEEIGEEAEIVYGMGEDTDIEYDGNCGYTVSFEGRWITFNGEYISSNVKEDNKNYTQFSSPIYVNGVFSDMIMVYDKIVRKVKLQGYIPMEGNRDGVMLTGRLTDFKTGDIITLLYDERTEYVENLIERKSFTYEDNMTLDIKYLPVGYYQYAMTLYDSYGNKYYSNIAVVFFDGNSTKIEVIADTEEISDEIK